MKLKVGMVRSEPELAIAGFEKGAYEAKHQRDQKDEDQRFQRDLAKRQGDHQLQMEVKDREFMRENGFMLHNGKPFRKYHPEDGVPPFVSSVMMISPSVLSPIIAFFADLDHLKELSAKAAAEQNGTPAPALISARIAFPTARIGFWVASSKAEIKY